MPPDILLLRRSPSSDPEEQAHFGGGDIGWQALGPALGCVVLSTSVVTARWIARRRVAGCEGLDDYVILLSLLLSWIMTGLVAAEVNGGMGMYAGPVELETIAKLVIASNCLWILIVNITKASILIQYLRIFSDRTVRMSCFALLFNLVPAICWAIFAGVFLCNPVAKLWNPNLPGHCMDASIYWLSVAGIDIGLDFLILLLPLPAITGLHLPRKQKLSLMLVFTLGFAVCIFSVVRLLTVLLSSNAGHYIESGVWAVVWSAVEANVGIICASFLSLKPLLVKLFPRMMDETAPPRHSMRLALVGDEEKIGIWRSRKWPRSSTSQPTVTSPVLVPRSTSHSTQSGSTFAKPSSPVTDMRRYSPQPLAAMEGITVVEPDHVRQSPREQAGKMSLFDMLAEDEDEAREWLGDRGDRHGSDGSARGRRV